MVIEPRRPILSPLMHERVTGLIMASAAGLQIGLTALGLPGWSCPFLHVLGIPCPGCGLSRALAALLQGDWQTSLTLHAFAPVFLIAIFLMAGAVVLPQPQKDWLTGRLELVERRTGIAAIILVSFLFYWLVRLLIFPEVFINLIKG
jgi:hypothetical protein